jgi:hypothetical protein
LGRNMVLALAVAGAQVIATASRERMEIDPLPRKGPQAVLPASLLT